MQDVVLLSVMVGVCGGLGLPLAELLPSTYRWRVLVAPTLGLCLLAIAAPVAYRVGVPSQVLLLMSAALALAFIIARARRLLRTGLPAPGGRRQAYGVVGWWLLATLVLLAPRWAGGDAFAVFQGNQWDTFGYLNSAAVYSREPYARVAAAQEKDFVREPLLVQAHVNLHARPSVHLLYSAFSTVAPGQAYRLYYPFLVFFLSQFMLVAFFVLRNLFPEPPIATLLAVALVFPLGFWGQYVLDINAWSQLSAVPVLFLLYWLWVQAVVFADPPGPPATRLRHWGAVALLLAGALFLYPEGLLYYLVALVPLSLAAVAVRVRRDKAWSPRVFFPLLGFAGAAAGALYFEGTVRFVLGQVRDSTQRQIVPWWRFFQYFLVGRDQTHDEASTDVVDFVGGLFGLYFATPSPEAGPLLAGLQRFAVAAVVIAIPVAFLALVKGLATTREGRSLSSEGRAALGVGAAGALLMLVPAAYLAAQGNYWPAGKGLSYVAPLFTTLLAVPLGWRFSRPLLKLSGGLVAVFVLFQLGSGLARVPAARSPHGIHYRVPYPAIQEPLLKKRLLWDLRALEPLVLAGTRVRIEPMNAWLENYLMVFLYTRGISFFKMTPVNTNFGTGVDLGDPPPAGPHEVSIAALDQTLRVEFRDGRPPVVLELSYPAGSEPR